MLMSEMRSVGNKGCLRHTLAAATLGRVHTYLIPQVWLTDMCTDVTGGGTTRFGACPSVPTSSSPLSSRSLTQSGESGPFGSRERLQPSGHGECHDTYDFLQAVDECPVTILYSSHSAYHCSHCESLCCPTPLLASGGVF